MARKQFFLTIVVALMLILILGCGSTPNPDPSIVWSDDFEDGDTEGWEQMGGVNEHFVSDGVVHFGSSGGGIYYRNSVNTGTWSFDAFLCKESQRTPEIWFIANDLGNDQYANFTINITKEPNTKLDITHLDGDLETKIGIVPVRDSEILTGWHHVDITRDDADNVKIFVDREFIYEFTEEYPYDSEGFFYHVSCEGPAIDNVVVRNQVIDIQPVK